MNDYFDSETFTKLDFNTTKIKKGEYDNCTFTNCNFENVHASNIQFLECEFIDCNFSNAIVTNTAFKEVSFINCKMIGVKFNECDPFLLQFSFKECQLNFSSFYKLKIQNTKFVNCNLQEVDFTETDVTNSLFDNCNLQKAIFENTILEKSDFKTAVGFLINPDSNRLKKAKFSKENIIGLLQQYNIIVEE